jgi:hypothetical protein
VTRRTAPRIAWLGAAATLVVAALVALGAILRGDFSDTDVKILVTLAAVLYVSGKRVQLVQLEGDADALRELLTAAHSLGETLDTLNRPSGHAASAVPPSSAARSTSAGTRWCCGSRAGRYAQGRRSQYGGRPRSGCSNGAYACLGSVVVSSALAP